MTEACVQALNYMFYGERQHHHKYLTMCHAEAQKDLSFNAYVVLKDKALCLQTLHHTTVLVQRAPAAPA